MLTAAWSSSMSVAPMVFGLMPILCRSWTAPCRPAQGLRLQRHRQLAATARHQPHHPERARHVCDRLRRGSDGG
ncbi:hypothetical protein E4K10_03990 [Streptomyces sp. T1317-0309]|nr:hypothetical protein E4K10_03990 [Streptomyces sp. T1317-0309]